MLEERVQSQLLQTIGDDLIFSKKYYFKDRDFKLIDSDTVEALRNSEEKSFNRIFLV